MLTAPSPRVVRAPGAAVQLGVLVPADLHPYWTSLLRRSGIPFRPIHLPTDAPFDASVVFLASSVRPPSPALLDQLRTMSARGVPIVADGWWAARLAGAPWRTIDAVGVTGRGPLFEEASRIRFEASVVVLEGAHLCRVWPSGALAGSILRDVSRRAAPIYVLPLPDAEALLRTPARLVELARGPLGGVHEIVAACDHGALRRFVGNALRQAFFARGLPFVRLGTSPHGYAGSFAVRVDADDFDSRATQATSSALARGGMRATWFIDVERHERKGGLASLPALTAAGHEVQSHFYRHYTYRSFARNRENLRRSIDVLRRHGVEATAAAAPFGTWNGNVQRALDSAGLAYSSEFARIHDDLPCRLPTNAGDRDTNSGAWQVPIHPVCPLLLFQAGLDVDGVHTYFEARMRDSLRRGEPAVFYGHPIRDLERCPDLFVHLDRALIDAAWATGEPVWRCTLGELHSFHRARAEQTIDCQLDEHGIHGDATGPAPLCIDRAGAAAVRVHGRFAVPHSKEPVESAQRPIVAAIGEDEIPEDWRADVRRARAWRQLRTRSARMSHEFRLSVSRASRPQVGR